MEARSLRGLLTNVLKGTCRHNRSDVRLGHRSPFKTQQCADSAQCTFGGTNPYGPFASGVKPSTFVVHDETTMTKRALLRRQRGGFANFPTTSSRLPEACTDSVPESFWWGSAFTKK